MTALLAFAGFAKSAFGALVQWLSRRSLAEIICIALAIALILTGYSRNHWKHVATTRQAQLNSCQSGRASDRQAYANAQAEASRANKQQVQKIETQQQKVTSDVESDYQRKLDAMRRELRTRGTATPQGSAGGSGAPQVPDAASGPGEASGVPLSDAERLRAAENELQLDELITWVEQQSAIDPNK